MDFFAPADRLGGPVALRVLGMVLVTCSVLLAGRIGSLVGMACGADGEAPTGTRRRASIPTRVHCRRC